MILRIAIFSRFPNDVSAPRGGVETVTLGLTAGLARRAELDVHVVTLERGREQIETTNVLGATIHRLPGSNWWQFFDVIRGPGRRRLRDYLCKLNPDVVHLHETHGLGIGRLPMPHVFTVHGFDHANLPAEKAGWAWLRAPLWKRLECWGFGQQQYIISISPYVRKQIEPHTQAEFFEIDNPVDSAFFDIPRQAVPGRLLMAGWISHRKNTLAALEAFGQLCKQGVVGSLHIAGEASDAAYGERVRRAIERLGIVERVRLLGRISPEELRTELSQASVFVLPSRQENAPMAISEAMAAGVPVVSSSRCGMPFMVDEGKTGFLVEPDDVTGLAQRLRRLMQDEPLRRRMGDAAHEVAKRRFHVDKVVERTLQVYRRAIGINESAPRGDGTAPSRVGCRTVN